MIEYRTVSDGNKTNVRAAPAGAIVATLEQDVIVLWDGVEQDGWKQVSFHVWTSKPVPIAKGDVGELDVHEGSGVKATFTSYPHDAKMRTCILVKDVWVSGERIEAVE